MKSVHYFAVILQTDRQNDRQTDSIDRITCGANKHHKTRNQTQYLVDCRRGEKN